MGLFSSKKKTKVGTAISRAIEDDALPNSPKTGLLKAIYEDGDVVDYVLEEFVGSVALRAERMYTYAENHYEYGLPSGKVVAATAGRQEVGSILASIEGGLVTLDYVNYGPANNYHIGWMRLISQHGYNPETNELPPLTALKGFPVYLEAMEVVLPSGELETMEPAALEQWGSSASSGSTPLQDALSAEVRQRRTQSKVVVDPLALAPHVRVHVIWEEVQETLAEEYIMPDAERFKRETFNIDLSGFDDEADYFHAKYRYGGVTKYWMYEVGSGTYPVLDALHDAPPQVSGTYFPFLYFRYGKQSMANLEGTPAYTTSKKLAKYLGINYAQMIEAVHENPDIGDVEQAMVILAVPPISEDPIEQRYLFEYFSEQYYHQVPPQSSPLIFGAWGMLERQFSNASQNAVVIQDQRFKLTLGNNGIFKKLVAGKIGPKGSYACAYGEELIPFAYIDAESGQTIETLISVGHHYYRYQITESVYEQLTVRELSLRYHIWGKYSTVGDEQDKILLIPLDHSITENYSLTDREQLYARAIHYVFNSRVTVKVKWYQTGIFQALLTLIAIVITIFTYGAAWQSIAAAVAAGTITVGAFLLTIAIGLLRYMVVTTAVKLFIKAVGPKLGLALAVLAAAVGAYYALDAGSLAGAPWAEGLLKVATNLASGVGDYMQGMMQDLVAEYEQFGLYVEEQNELLKQGQDLLKNDSLLSPFVVLGESPTDFFNRTVHAGNIGTVGISAIHDYVGNSLRLPTLTDTLGHLAVPQWDDVTDWPHLQQEDGT